MTDTTHQPKPEKKLPESATSDSKAADQTAASARFVNGRIIPNRLTGLMIALVAMTLSVFGLLLYVQAVQQPQTTDSEAQVMPPGIPEMGSVWLEATTAENGTVADISVYARSSTNIFQAIATVEWDVNQAYYDIETPATINPGLDCYKYNETWIAGSSLTATYQEDGRKTNVNFMGSPIALCDPGSTPWSGWDSYDWSKAYPAGNRILIGKFRIRSRVAGQVPLRVVPMTAIINQYAHSIGNPGSVSMTGTTVTLSPANTTPGTPTPRPTSTTVRSEFILNSASGKSCKQLCQEQQMWCHSIGTLQEPITGTNEFMGLGGGYWYWDAGLDASHVNKCKVANACGNGKPPGMPIGWAPEPNTTYCGEFLDSAGNVRPAGGPNKGCDAVMKAWPDAQSCGYTGPDAEVYQTDWTYCYCKSGPSPTPRTSIVLPAGPTATPRPEVTPIIRASGTTPCECPLNYACTRDGQSCINLKTVYSDYDFSGTNMVSYTKYCTDGTLNKQCSENGPFKCTTYYTAYKPSGLHPSCGSCGCPSGETCNADGTCGIEYSRVPGQKCEVWKGQIDGRYTGGVKCSGEFYVYPGYGSGGGSSGSSSTVTPTQPTRPYVPDPINPPIVTRTPGLSGIPTIPIEMHATVTPTQPTRTFTPPGDEPIIPTPPSSLEDFVSFLSIGDNLEKLITLLRSLVGR